MSYSCKFGSIVCQIGDNLLETNHVAAEDFGYIGVDIKYKLYIILVDTCTDNGCDIIDQRCGLVVIGNNVHFARVYLGEVKNIVDDGEQ